MVITGLTLNQVARKGSWVRMKESSFVCQGNRAFLFSSSAHGIIIPEDRDSCGEKARLRLMCREGEIYV